MSGIWSGIRSERRAAGLDDLRQRARADLAVLNFPPANWVPATVAAGGQQVLDVLVVGGGYCGQSVAFALMREGIRDIRIVDRAERGGEGPWDTFARMEILRSPKHLTGPDLGVPSLTFRAWFEAQHGPEGWGRLHKIGRLDWRDYLLWLRETVGVEVENEVSVTAIRPRERWVEVDLVRQGWGQPPLHGTSERSERIDAESDPTSAGAQTLLARRVVLATGRDGAGGPRRPTFVGLGADQTGGGRVWHAEEVVDERRYAGRRVAVLGGQATAFDTAATALEAGAAEVVMYSRRRFLPQVNKSKGLSYPGALRGLGALPDADRWRMMTFVFAEQTPPPWESVERCNRFNNFTLRFAMPWHDVKAHADGLAVATPAGVERFDLAVLATGFDVDLTRRPELAAISAEIALWSDRVDAAEIDRHPEAVRFPYLGPGFELVARNPARIPGLDRVHLFNWGTAVSHGALAGDIPGLRFGVERLIDSISRAFFLEDREHHWRAVRDLEDPELKPTRFYVPPEGRGR
jgi:cation diffusion facilitator CzcD-associated flavoprotein CzcO